MQIDGRQVLPDSLKDEFGGRMLPLQADITDKAAVARLLDTAQAQTSQPIVSIVNNALADFRFDGDARPSIGAIDWTRSSSGSTVRSKARSTRSRLRRQACVRKLRPYRQRGHQSVPESRSPVSRLHGGQTGTNVA